MKIDKWITEKRDAATAKRTCVICRDHGPKTASGKALQEYLDLPLADRHGVMFTTFIREFMQEKLGIVHAPPTWKSHIVKCLGRGEHL